MSVKHNAFFFSLILTDFKLFIKAKPKTNKSYMEMWRIEIHAFRTQAIIRAASIYNQTVQFRNSAGFECALQS